MSPESAPPPNVNATALSRLSTATFQASALVIGAIWLRRHGAPGSAGVAMRMERKGRRSLARAIRTLVAVDGSFAQQSTNYHRLVLDTLALTVCGGSFQ